MHKMTITETYISIPVFDTPLNPLYQLLQDPQLIPHRRRVLDVLAEQLLVQCLLHPGIAQVLAVGEVHDGFQLEVLPAEARNLHVLALNLGRSSHC